MKEKVINKTEDLLEVIHAQEDKRTILFYSGKEALEEIDKLEQEGKKGVLLAILDDNDGTNSYVKNGIFRVNNIGYYVLEGNYVVKDYLEI